MGTVLIHAGTPKTGSTSIQSWLRTHAGHLRDHHGISVVRDTGGQGKKPFRIERFESGPNVVSNAFLLLYAGARRQQAHADLLTELTTKLFDEIDRVATEHGTVVITAEAFASLFAEPDEPFLGALEGLADRHTTTVAYYARPQHTAIEARWRQWGHRTTKTPAAWVLDQAAQLHYAETAEHAARLAPSVDFVVRPFRLDLLEDSSVVVDFARHFLGIDDPPGAVDIDENPGLPLDLANLLRTAPRDLLSTEGALIEPGLRQQQVGTLARSWAIPESQAAEQSRDVLRRYALRTYEPGNRALIERFGWPANDGFIEAPSEDTNKGEQGDDLEELDRLWHPDATAPAAIAYLHAALKALANATARRA